MLVERMMEEMKQKPFTMVLIFALAVTTGTLWAKQRTYAQEVVVQSLKEEVVEVKKTVQRTAAEADLRAVTTEIFNIQRQIAVIKDQRKVPDQIYYDRLRDLENDKASIERKLGRL